MKPPAKGVRWVAHGLGAMSCLFGVLLAHPSVYGAPAGAMYGTGASDTEIVIGNTMPYSGPASVYGANGHAIAAYFKKINAEGGVNGRMINFISYDDAYSPPRTVEQVRRLVEKDGVLLVFAPLGTAPNTAIQKYLNANKVPHLFVFTGASKWGDPEHYPWTMGLAPNYFYEAKIYANYILAHIPNPRIGILFQNDDYGKDYVAGLKSGLADKAGLIVSEQSYEVTDPVVDSQLVNLKNSGANVFFNVSTPKFAAMAIRRVAEMGWHPTQFLNNVSTTVGSVMIPAGLKNGTGIISAHYLKDPFDPQFDKDPAVTDWRAFMKEFNPQANPLDFANVVGYNAAQVLVHVLRQCGNDLTRDNVMRQATSLRAQTFPMLLPGITITTSPTDYYPISQFQLMRFTGERWEHFGDVLNAKSGT